MFAEGLAFDALPAPRPVGHVSYSVVFDFGRRWEEWIVSVLVFLDLSLGLLVLDVNSLALLLFPLDRCDRRVGCTPSCSTTSLTTTPQQTRAPYPAWV